jgi:hypothetical protein
MRAAPAPPAFVGCMSGLGRMPTEAIPHRRPRVRLPSLVWPTS